MQTIGCSHFFSDADVNNNPNNQLLAVDHLEKMWTMSGEKQWHTAMGCKMAMYWLSENTSLVMGTRIKIRTKTHKFSMATIDFLK